ncbi:MAG: TerB family tellurite resistance protein [Candidatus Lambdaproteobacteria bacterium]|nr:TerB family tellurite resistance protein [Candidatus Lambdaproteobacteria bacterium]
MLDKLKAMLAGASSGPARLTEFKPDLQVAVCAILLEVARADQEFTEAERATIRRLLADRFTLGAAEVEGLIALAEEERRRSPDLWPFTNAIAKAYAPEEKLPLLVMVWQVILADARLDAQEDHLAHRLQQMLLVNHSVLMEAKRQARALAARENVGSA